MDPPDPTWEIFEILLLHVLSNDAWQFAINLFSISWGPFENVNLPFFYWKCRLEVTVMHLILQERYQCKSFISQFRKKLWNGPPWPNMKSFEILLLHVLSNDAWQFAINLFSSVWKMAVMILQKLHKRYQCKSPVKDQNCGMPPWMRNFEILLLHVLSSYVCKFAINLFSISWGPFENVDILFFLSKMQIWNDCNALNIAGNCIKDINVNLSFLSLGSKLWNEPPVTKMRKFWNSSFACTVQWCMTICHKCFPSAEGHLKMLIYYFLYWKCKFETPWKISM